MAEIMTRIGEGEVQLALLRGIDHPPGRLGRCVVGGLVEAGRARRRHLRLLPGLLRPAAPGPKAPEGKDSNWLQTIPGKSFFVCLRMYGPTEPWIEGQWRPSDVELVE